MAIQYAGGVNRNDLYAARLTANACIAAINTTLVAAGWTATAVKAFVTLTATGDAANNDTITVAGKVYTFKTTINNANNGEVTRGGGAADTLSNLQAALNLGAGSGTAYSTATTLNATLEGGALTSTTLVIQEKTGGSSAAVAVSESVTNMTLSGGNTIDGGYKFNTAITPQLLQGRLYVFNHNEGTTIFRLQMMNTEESEVGPTNITIDGSASCDLRVIANKYQCFIFVNGASSATGNTFWGCGVPWIPDFMAGVAVANVVNAAGVAKITTSAAHNLTTGNAVTTRGILGATGANLTNNNVTVIDSLNFTLDGSTFGGAYTSGGVVGVTIATSPQLPRIAEAIWSAGGNGSIFIRKFLHGQASPKWVAINGSSYTTSTGESALTFATVALDNVSPDNELLWFNGANFAAEPFIGWASSDGAVCKIIGQTWDTMNIRKGINSTDVSGITGTADSHNWFNLTGNNTSGSGIIGSCLHVVP